LGGENRFQLKFVCSRGKAGNLTKVLARKGKDAGPALSVQKGTSKPGSNQNVKNLGKTASKSQPWPKANESKLNNWALSCQLFGARNGRTTKSGTHRNEKKRGEAKSRKGWPSQQVKFAEKKSTCAGGRQHWRNCQVRVIDR